MKAGKLKIKVDEKIVVGLAYRYIIRVQILIYKKYRLQSNFESWSMDVSNSHIMILRVNNTCVACFTIIRNSNNCTEAVYVIDKNQLIKAIDYYKSNEF
jgi:hypothetical protein